MTTDPPKYESPIGLVAGNGSLPISFVAAARQQGFEVVAAGHVGETDDCLALSCSEFVWVRVGQVGKILRFLKKNGVKQLAFAGGIRRVNLFGGVRLDGLGLKILSRTRSVRDDALLRAIAQEFESNGIRVIAPTAFLRDFIPGGGAIGSRMLSLSEESDAKIGWSVAKKLGEADAGQAVVVYEGLVIALEGIEGTDALIRRAGDLVGGRGGVLVKVSKPAQDLRLDMPTIGLTTIEQVAASGLTAVVLEADKTMVLDPVEVVSCANRNKIAVVALPHINEG
jgi:DUF1009 family protein